MDEREFWLGIRRGLLLWLDLIERRFDVQPTTSRLRSAHKVTRTETTE